ncbi:MAG: histidine kinase [Rhizobiales bacterium 63-22]|nr:MAG: histidine kinase [Rhizobiales bacterium 63-22]
MSMPEPIPDGRDTARVRALLRAVSNCNICVLYQRPDQTYEWGENIPVYWTNCWKPDVGDEDFIVSTALDRLKAARTAALETMTPQSLELPVMDGDRLRWLAMHVDCDCGADGRVRGLVTTVQEITETKRREQVLKALLREVSHRSKNLLAIVQSIASQTARFTDSIDDFLLKFRGRIQSLSYSQDLVTDSNWHGALLRDLVYSQVEKYIDLTDERISIEGDNPYLFPGAALHVGLALHELVVNATSFGGLSIPAGHVAISAHVIRAGSHNEQLVLRWQETNPAMPEIYEHDPRFGSAVLQRIVPAAVNGHADYRVGTSGAIYALTIPAEQFDS